jgi:hypothetical protein
MSFRPPETGQLKSSLFRRRYCRIRRHPCRSMNLLIALTSLTLFASACPSSAQAQTADAVRGSLSAAEAWQEVEAVHAQIRSSHPDPYWYNEPNIWSAQLAILRERKGRISLERQYFDLASLMSLAMDTHVQIYPNADTPGFESSYPIRFRQFDEGVFVVAADKPYRGWVGAQIVSIKGRSIDDLTGELSAYAFSDHPARKHSFAIEYLLPHPATYRQLGLTNEDGSVTLQIRMRDGSAIEGRLLETVMQGYSAVLESGTAAGYYWPRGWRTLDDLDAAAPPVSRQHLDRNYWRTDLADGSVAYLQLNVPADQAGRETLLEFTTRTFAEWARRKPHQRRLIIDIRHDLGGSIGRSLPIAYLARASGFCCEPGKVIFLIGRETISAGSILAGAIETANNAISIGEPSGGRPNLFLGHAEIELPYSHFKAQISNDFFIGTDSTDKRMFLAPDVLVPERIADVVSGHDIALEQALSITDEEARAFYPKGAEVRPWSRPSQAAALRIHPDPHGW